MKITKGIKVQDDLQYKKVQDERIQLKADRARTDTQKGLDDLLFGPGAVRGRRQKVEQVTQNNTNNVVKPTPPPPVQSKKQTTQKETVIVKPLPPINQKTVNQGIKPKPKQEIKNQIKKQDSKNYNKIEPVETFKSQNSGRLLFNRPNYIRKLKKIAQNFQFKQINANNHTYFDIVKPYECNRNRCLLQQQLNSTSNGFIDTQFPPSYLSLGINYRRQNIQWKRAYQFCNKPTFGKYVEPNDIQIGKLTCPSFASILSCLSQRQRNIKRLIEDQQYNPNGFYYVRLNINSVWRYFSVDDNLPIIDNDNVGLLSFQDSQSDISLSLIQKAYAKAYSGYSVFEKNCKPEHYLRDLTGSRVARYRINDSTLLDNLQFSLQQNWTIIAVPNSRISQIGLNSKYNLGIVNLTARGLQLRNSWGTTTQRPSINFSKEGLFELSLQDALKYIDYVLVAQTDDKYHTTTIQSKHHTGFYSSYSFRIKSNVQTIISANQWDHRLFPSAKNYAYSQFRLLIERKNKGSAAEYVSGGFTNGQRNLDLLVTLSPGDYTISCIGSWNQGFAYDYSVSVYTIHALKFDKNYTQTFPNVISQSLQQLNLSNGKKTLKGQIDQYILYHQPTNLLIITTANATDKAIDYTQDLSKITFNSLNLLNVPNQEENFDAKLYPQVSALKQSHNSDRRWYIHLGPKQAYTWVISTTENYSDSNLKIWGFK